MRSGSVITIRDFIFLSGEEDRRDYLRKCIVLFEEIINEEEYIWICPIVEQKHRFNQFPFEYYLLPLTNRNGRKMLFAQLSNTVPIKKEEVIEQIDLLDIKTTKRMIQKLIDNYKSYNHQEYFESIMNIVEEKNIGVK